MSACLLFVSWPSLALAGDEERSEAAQAQAAFDEAKTLIMRGDWAAACPKLEKSLRLEPRPTTQYRLAECYERTEKVAAAWRAYSEAASAASTAGEPQRAEFAKQRAKRLEPMVAFLMLSIADHGATVHVDGRPLDDSDSDLKLAVDPGDHTVSARAPGKETFYSKVKLLAGSTTVLTIPILDPSGGKSESRASVGQSGFQNDRDKKRPSTNILRSLRPWGIGFAGIGLLSAGIGTLVYVGGQDSGGRNECEGGCVAGSTMIIAGAGAFVMGAALFAASFAGADEPSTAAQTPPWVIRF